MEKSLILIKPDAVCKKLIGETIKYFEKNNLKIVALKMFFFNEEQAKNFYKVHKDKHFFDGLVAFMITAPCIAMVVEGKNAIFKCREIIGARSPKEAIVGTIRKDLASDGRRNIVHASDSKETASYEINFFFSEKEIYKYSKKNWLNSQPDE